MRAKLLLVLGGALAVSACATAPNAPEVSGAPQVPVNFVGCISNLLPPTFVNADPRAVLILVGLEMGYDLGAYSTCTVERLVHPTAAGTVSDGVYRSGQGTFSIALPSPPTGAQRPSIDIIQPSVLPSEAALLQPLDDGEAMKSGAVLFGVTMSRETPLELSGTVEQAGLEELDRGNTAIRTGPYTPTLLNHEAVTLDGRPALFAIYSMKPIADASQGPPTYLFIYFTRYQDDSAVLAVRWSGDCPPCATGHEADIRRLDPNIGRLAESFHLDEAALLAWDTANPMPAGKPAPPALPHVDIPPGKALIYFYRESHFAGGGLNFHVAEDGNEFGTLPNGTYLHTVVDPGTHAFVLTTWRSDDDPCQVQVASGEVRYIELYVSQPAVWGHSLMLSCRESPELETRTKMEGLKESTDD